MKTAWQNELKCGAARVRVLASWISTNISRPSSQYCNSLYGKFWGRYKFWIKDLQCSSVTIVFTGLQDCHASLCEWREPCGYDNGLYILYIFLKLWIEEENFIFVCKTLKKPVNFNHFFAPTYIKSLTVFTDVLEISTSNIWCACICILCLKLIHKQVLSLEKKVGKNVQS